MTPKEKAKELVIKMCLNDCTDKNIYNAKKLSIIAVNEILDIVGNVAYWVEVKHILNNAFGKDFEF